MNKEKTNDKCIQYNWGGDSTKERPLYPREYGARCEKYDKFFSLYGNGKLEPSCLECKINNQTYKI